ncbi:hypothetical protein NX023_03960 [Cytobacillus firmus]|nr:hypothetical protein [Cytobacillus firmus]
MNQLSDEEIFFNLLISSLCLLLIILSYHLRFKSRVDNSNTCKQEQIDKGIKNNLYKKLIWITDIIFIVAVLSIILLIIETGSIKTYLALGALTRGLDKAPTAYIRSSYLQLVTLSVIILVTPYLYIYLYRFNKSKVIAIKFIISLIFAILFLLYNQGRAPLVIFFLPFLFTIQKQGKKGFLGLTVMFGIGLFLLNYLDRLFKFLAYGNFVVEEKTNVITMFLSEFSYPFTNFSLRNELIGYSGYRYMYDYLIWPFTMVPSSILELVGFNKESITSISNINTEAYGFFLGVTPSGGIPVDLLTFNFYQFGYISLIPICFIIGRILRKLDLIFNFFEKDYAIKILLYRISFSMINLMNNADISAIVRNRLDVVVLLIILIYIYRNTKNTKTKHNNKLPLFTNPQG